MELLFKQLGGRFVEVEEKNIIEPRFVGRAVYSCLSSLAVEGDFAHGTQGLAALELSRAVYLDTHLIVAFFLRVYGI